MQVNAPKFSIREFFHKGLLCNAMMLIVAIESNLFSFVHEFEEKFEIRNSDKHLKVHLLK